MDDLMQTTVKEVAEVMEVSGTFVQLGVLPTHSTEDADSREAL
jgi:hypothetical protein